MMTPGQASRIACWISRDTLTSHDGRCPLSGSCWRRWICITLAPALNAALASRAICSGVTGTWCCFGSVNTPFSAQVITALSPMDEASPDCALLRSDEQNTEMVGDVTGGACPGRDAAFFTLLRRTGTVPNTGVWYGTGSAA